MWLTQHVEATSSEHRPHRRRRRRRDTIGSGKLSLKVQVGIIVAAFGIAAIGLLAFLGLLGRPTQPVPVDQALIDAQWNP